MTIKIKKVTRKGKVFYRWQMLGKNGRKLNDLYNTKSACKKQIFELITHIEFGRVTIIDVDGKEI